MPSKKHSQKNIPDREKVEIREATHAETQQAVRAVMKKHARLLEMLAKK